MKVTTLALSLFLAAPAFAQTRVGQTFTIKHPQGEDTAPTTLLRPNLEYLITAREKLIRKYSTRLGNGMAWGFSVCGSEGAFSQDDRPYICAYVYDDRYDEFMASFGKDGLEQQDGIPIVVTQIRRPQH